MLPENITAIVARNERWSGEAASEPYEAGWAREAIIFVRALKEPEGPAAAARVEISPDGMHWVPEGTEGPMPARRGRDHRAPRPPLRKLAPRGRRFRPRRREHRAGDATPEGLTPDHDRMWDALAGARVGITTRNDSRNGGDGVKLNRRASRDRGHARPDPGVSVERGVPAPRRLPAVAGRRVLGTSRLGCGDRPIRLLSATVESSLVFMRGLRWRSRQPSCCRCPPSDWWTSASAHDPAPSSREG